jgi:hypothetical protein
VHRDNLFSLNYIKKIRANHHREFFNKWVKDLNDSGLKIINDKKNTIQGTPSSAASDKFFNSILLFN